MSKYFQVNDFYFYPGKNEVHRLDEVIKVRPKTAELLIVLLEADGEIVSKPDLLNTVWNDVVVEEHVIFQSITELRKIFNDTPIIKTHPRKGYSVTAKVIACEETPNYKPNVDTTNTAIDKRGNTTTYGFIGLVSLLVIACFILLFLNKPFSSKSNIAENGSVIVLPVDNRIEDSEQMWVRYGGMDLLIKYLQTPLSAPVLPTEMVLDTLKRADINGEIGNAEIARLFDVSGAQVIVAHAVSGFSGDYQLVYSIYERSRVNRGVLFAEEINTLFSDLNALLLSSMGLNSEQITHSYQHNFTNELMAAAFDEIQLDNYQQAATMFQAVLVSEPENILAIKMLVKTLVMLSQYNEAELIAAEAIKGLKQSVDTKNLGRILFWQAVSITQQGKYDEALPIIVHAKTKSADTNDLLYLANSARVTGRIYLRQGKFEQSRQELLKALSFYKAIKEPYGQSSVYIDLGELELTMGNTKDAQTAFNKALNFAEKSHLKRLIVMSKDWIIKTQNNLD